MHTGYFDGATNPNPGELGLGACIVDHKGDEVIATSSYRPYGTNNEAEYLSLILLLKMAKKAGIKELECYGDSKLIINQVNKFVAQRNFIVSWLYNITTNRK